MRRSQKTPELSEGLLVGEDDEQSLMVGWEGTSTLLGLGGPGEHGGPLNRSANHYTIFIHDI